MKRLLFIGVLITFGFHLSFVAAQDDGKIVKGGFKGATICGYDYKFGMANNTTKIRLQANKYDGKGNIIEKIIYKADSTIEKKIKYKYDDKGNETEQIKYDSLGGIIDVKTCQYNQNGNKSKEIEYHNDGTIQSKEAFKYNDNGKKIERIRYNGKGAVSDMSRYKYDEKGYLTEQIDSGSVSGLITDLYKTAGNENKNDVKPTGNDQIVFTFFFKYDEKGNETEVSVQKAQEKVWIISTSKYDEKGRIVEKINYQDATSVQSKTSLKYDDNGNIVQKETYDSNHGNEKLTFKYDEKSNILEQVEYDYIIDEPRYKYEWSYFL
ncbi:MAG TPA: hypothetical protein PKI01_07885 [Bacteroidales bacterium]|nr:hypothetical protein [Bacteroidales bacterium]